jgi:hypothetical protein
VESSLALSASVAAVLLNLKKETCRLVPGLLVTIAPESRFALADVRAVSILASGMRFLAHIGVAGALINVLAHIVTVLGLRARSGNEVTDTTAAARFALNGAVTFGTEVTLTADLGAGSTGNLSAHGRVSLEFRAVLAVKLTEWASTSLPAVWAVAHTRISGDKARGNTRVTHSWKLAATVVAVIAVINVSARDNLVIFQKRRVARQANAFI